MTFEFDYDVEAAEITITFDGRTVRASFDGDSIDYVGLSRLDEDQQDFFKAVCKAAFKLIEG